MLTNKLLVNTAILALTSGLLAGCGAVKTDMRDTEKDMVPASPVIVSPDPEDGVVEDGDGMIVEDEPAQTRAPFLTETSPSASLSAAPSVSPKASPANG